MSAQLCSYPDGRPVTKSEEKELRLYAMTDSQVSGFDCGSRGHSDFPEQMAMPTVKPLLSDLLQKVAEHEAKLGCNPVLFNIEIKSGPDGDRIFHPEVAEFTDIVIQTLIRAGTLERSTIQSFDPRALEAVHKINTKIGTVLLVKNEDGLQENLDRLSFTPTVYSPHYKLVDTDLLTAAHKQGIKVIPWTVNEASIMRKLIKLGVNGLITDYPSLGVNVVAESQAMPSSHKCVGNVFELPKAARSVSSKDGTSK
jgi:glycerophosphoryl diester phosphodiesterase